MHRGPPPITPFILHPTNPTNPPTRRLQAMHSTKVYSRLSERLGLADHAALLSVMLGKLAKNLTVYAQAEPLVHSTLILFQVSCRGGCRLWRGYRQQGGACQGRERGRTELQAVNVDRSNCPAHR